jgi:hypothetical protein
MLRADRTTTYHGLIQVETTDTKKQAPCARSEEDEGVVFSLKKDISRSRLQPRTGRTRTRKPHGEEPRELRPPLSHSSERREDQKTKQRETSARVPVRQSPFTGEK